MAHFCVAILFGLILSTYAVPLKQTGLGVHDAKVVEEDHIASSKPYNVTHWMEDLQDILYNQSLLAITLPGTHDSGAYYFTDVMSPLDANNVQDLIDLCTKLHINIFSFIKPWAQSQGMSVYDQLCNGIRYIDLRPVYINNSWYTEHFLVGLRTEVALLDIQKFMSENTGEVVVVEFGELNNLTAEITLIQMLNNTIREFAALPMDLYNTTIGQMVEKNQRLIMLYENNYYDTEFPFLWNKTYYIDGSYANKDSVSSMVDWNEGEITTQGGNGKIFELSWTLTAQTSDIVKTLLDPFAKERTLKDYALEANGAFDAFAEKYSNYQLGNILLCDWFQDSNIVNYTIQFNLRQCHDDPNFVAVNSNGQYCRNFFKTGMCHNATRTEWMSEHCRLSCGFC